MIVSDTSIRKRVGVVVLAILIVAIGLYCYRVLPRENEPDITIPYVFINTTYRGVSPPDMETSVTIPIEKKLTGLENVKKIQSISSEGVSSIIIEFTTGTDIDDVLQKVKDKVDEANPDLPTDLEEDPSVFEVNISEMPIAVYSLTGSIESSRLKEIADDLSDEIETIPGVLGVDVTGGLEREIRVEFLPEKLTYFSLSPQQLENTLRQENQNVSGGFMRMADGRFMLQTPGELKTPQDFLQLVVGNHNGQPIYLTDVALVYDGFKEESSRSRLNGQPAVNIMVKKRAGENIIAIADQVEALLEEIAPTWPVGTRVTKLMDKAKDIRNMNADLENNLISGLILVILVLPFALGFRNAILVGLAIPFSMFLSFIVLYALGITLNLVVLFSLTLALGMLVDNAIVIIENIYRFTSQGVPRVQAAMRATSEVAYPVIGSTLTTIAAFFPMLFWPGIMGEFMSYLPLTLIITLSSSLFVALVINPALASMLLKVDKSRFVDPENGHQTMEQLMEKPVVTSGFILSRYKKFLEGVLNNRIAVLLISFALLIIIFQVWLLRVGLEKPVEFFPDIDPASMYVNIDMPEGADLELADRISKQIEMAIAGVKTGNNEYINTDQYDETLSPKEHQTASGKKYSSLSDLPNVEHLYSKAVSVSGGADMFSVNTPTHIGVQFLDFKNRSTPSRETLAEIRQRVKYIPGGKITVTKADEGPPTGPPINIEITGDDFTVLGRIAREIRNIAAKNPFVEDIRDDYQSGTPTIRLRIDRQKAALLGLSSSAIGQALKNAYNGLEVSTYREKDKEYDITIQIPESYRRNTEMLENLIIASPTGALIPLSTLAKFEYTGSLGRIVRINNERVVTVTANVDEMKIPGPVARAQVEKYINELELPPGYRVTFTGEQEAQQESEDFLKKAFLVAIFLVSLVLITQFNSIGLPMIIVSSVILSLGGAFLGLTIHKASFGIIMTGVGVISLAGVVVNNGIVLIDYINQLRSRGYDCRQSIINGACTRLRPVLLTAITTILGLIPMVTGVSYDFHTMEIAWASESSQWWKSMAIAVIYGLMMATLLTLVIVPILYSMLDSLQRGTALFRQGAHTAYWKVYERLFN
ncbi:MAG: efflux RND transporter permease subunit [Proteobacteria bacterium]|nr:efflux RND transporter permease subunit [Pseudomonadota bacterium]